MEKKFEPPDSGCKQRTHQAPSLINGKESTSRHITGNFHNTRDGENIQESSRKHDEGWGRNPGKASGIRHQTSQQGGKPEDNGTVLSQFLTGSALSSDPGPGCVTTAKLLSLTGSWLPHL